MSLLLDFSVAPKDICIVLNKTDDLRNPQEKSLRFYTKKKGIEIKSVKDVQKIEKLCRLSLGEVDKFELVDIGNYFSAYRDNCCIYFGPVGRITNNSKP